MLILYLLQIFFSRHQKSINRKKRSFSSAHSKLTWYFYIDEVLMNVEGKYCILFYDCICIILCMMYYSYNKMILYVVHCHQIHLLLYVTQHIAYSHIT
jgi:hypothetical protein